MGRGQCEKQRVQLMQQQTCQAWLTSFQTSPNQLSGVETHPQHEFTDTLAFVTVC